MSRYFLAAAAACLAVCSYAQERKSNNERDTLQNRQLEEVVISANKVEQSGRLVAQQFHVIRPTQIAGLNAQSTADLLANTGVVAMQKSQQGGGSPILRGFEASRILLVVDGIRMNNLIYRAGHLQNVITLDQNIMDRTEVLFGPSSTVYGSDALGGAVAFFTMDPKLRGAGTDQTASGNAFFRYGTVNDEKSFHAHVNLAGEQVASLTSFNISDFGDLKMGKKTNSALGEPFGLRNQFVRRSADGQSDELVDSDAPYVQRQSGYVQKDFFQKIIYRPSARVSHLFNLQYSTSTDIPRYDRLTDPGANGVGLKFAQWHYGPQQRMLAYYRLQMSDLGKLADQMTLTLSNQDIVESRHQRRFNSTSLQHRVEHANIWGLSVDFQKGTRKNDYRYGLDGQFNTLRSTAEAEDILTGATSALDTRYPGGANSMNFMAAYITHTRRITDKLVLNDGLRAGTSRLTARFTDKTFFPFPFDDVKQNNLTGSGSLGLVYTPQNWKLSVLGSSGFRSPNIDDLAKVFESVAGSATTTGTLIIPNPNLKPEKSVNLDLGVVRYIGAGRIGGNIFVTRMFDVIATLPFRLGGLSSVNFDGFPAVVYTNQNRNKALIYGASFQADVPLSDRWKLAGSWNYTKGILSDDAPLDHIAPVFGRLSVQYVSGKLSGEVFSNYSGWKRLDDYSSSGEDNLQYATAKGMPSWYTLNLRFSADVGTSFTFQAGIDNLLDLQYRTFASGINAPGRNIFVTARVRF